MRTFLLLVKGGAEVTAEKARQKLPDANVEFVKEANGSTTLRVKGENKTWDALERWFSEDGINPPFPIGSLLWYNDERTGSMPS